jgi:hypothetical protein
LGWRNSGWIGGREVVERRADYLVWELGRSRRVSRACRCQRKSTYRIVDSGDLLDMLLMLLLGVTVFGRGFLLAKFDFLEVGAFFGVGTYELRSEELRYPELDLSSPLFLSS